jgi:hypothetical protein
MKKDMAPIVARVGELRVRFRPRNRNFRVWGPDNNVDRGIYPTLAEALDRACELAGPEAKAELFEGDWL